MKVLHTIEVMDERYGGLPICTANLLEGLRGVGVDADMLTLYDGEGIGPVRYSSKVCNMLKESNPDLFHVNGMWMHIVHKTCQVARRKGIPYVLTPHGMLYRDALKISQWKKLSMLALWFRRDVMEANCVHVTCPEERDELREFGYRGPIAVNANPIKIDDDVTDIFTQRKAPNFNPNREIKLGYLGRLHPRKRVELILQGMVIANNKNTSLRIIGEGSQPYISFLINEINRLGLRDQVEFLGYKGGTDKFRELAKLDALIVPSDMENFGMVVPEALLVGTPVMASTGTPWKALNTVKAGWWRKNTPEDIASVIDQIAELSPSELLTMGTSGRTFVKETFEVSKIASQMKMLYQWLLGDSPKPSFVYEY